MYIAMFNRLLVKLDAQIDKITASGLVLMEDGQKVADRGEVVSVGEGYVNERNEVVKTRIQVGQRVIFRPGMGYEILEENVDKFVFLVESDVLGVEILDTVTV